MIWRCALRDRHVPLTHPEVNMRVNRLIRRGRKCEFAATDAVYILLTCPHCAIACHREGCSTARPYGTFRHSNISGTHMVPLRSRTMLEVQVQLGRENTVRSAPDHCCTIISDVSHRIADVASSPGDTWASGSDADARARCLRPRKMLRASSGRTCHGHAVLRYTRRALWAPAEFIL